MHEFNEAVYFAMKEFSNYVNLAQVESATYNFFMDQLLDEQNRARKKPLEPIKDNFGKQKAKKSNVVKRDNTGKIIEDPSSDEDEVEEPIYPINQNGPKKLTAYSHIFVNRMPCKTITGQPKKKTYQDTLHDKKVSDFLRKRDLDKLLNIDSFGKNVVQSETELFRSFKICDLEFTRYAFQIMMEEAHRRAVHMMALMFISTPRSKSSHRPDEESAMTKTSDKVELAEREEMLSLYYEKFKTNHMLKKREAASVRESFRDMRMQRLRSKKNGQMQDNARIMFDGDHVKVPEVNDSDLHHPLNHVGYERFRNWLRAESKLDNKILDTVNKDKKKALFKNKRHFADDHDEEETGGLEAQKTFDMNNILLSLNYFTGFGATIIEAGKKLAGENDEDNAAEEDDKKSRQDSDEDAD